MLRPMLVRPPRRFGRRGCPAQGRKGRRIFDAHTPHLPTPRTPHPTTPPREIRTHHGSPLDLSLPWWLALLIAVPWLVVVLAIYAVIGLLWLLDVLFAASAWLVAQTGAAIARPRAAG